MNTTPYSSAIHIKEENASDIQQSYLKNPEVRNLKSSIDLTKWTVRQKSGIIDRHYSKPGPGSKWFKR